MARDTRPGDTWPPPPHEARPSGWENVEKILVVRLDNMGDVLMCTPALRAIKENLPGVRVTFWASPGGHRMAPLIVGVDDWYVERVIWQDTKGSMPLDPWRERRIVDWLRDQGFGASLIFTSFSQSPYPPAYLCYLAGIPRRVGQSKEFGGSVLSTWVKPPPDAGHQVDRNLHLLQSIGFALSGSVMHAALPDDGRQQLAEKLAAGGVGGDGDYILIHPGASCPSRVYYRERFAVLASLLAERHHLPVLISGDAREAEVAAWIAARAGDKCRSLAGQTTVVEFAALVKGAKAVITNHTSTMHLADVFARPNVVLFSGTDLESQWQPRWSPSLTLRRPVPCSPCYRFTCPYNLECLDIPPGEVAAAVEMVWR